MTFKQWCKDILFWISEGDWRNWIIPVISGIVGGIIAAVAVASL